MTDRDEPRRRAAETKRQRTRAAILRAAQELLDTQSWHDLRMEDVAEDAGVSIATVYNHYRTKPILITRLFSSLVMPLMAQVAQAARRSRDSGKPTNIVELYVTALVQFADNYRNVTAGYLAAVFDESVTPEEAGFHYTRDGERGSLVSLGLRSFLPEGTPAEVADYHMYGVLAMIVLHAELTVEETTEMVLSQILPTLKAL